MDDERPRTPNTDIAGIASRSRGRPRLASPFAFGAPLRLQEGPMQARSVSWSVHLFPCRHCIQLDHEPVLRVGAIVIQHRRVDSLPHRRAVGQDLDQAQMPRPARRLINSERTLQEAPRRRLVQHCTERNEGRPEGVDSHRADRVPDRRGSITPMGCHAGLFTPGPLPGARCGAFRPGPRSSAGDARRPCRRRKPLRFRAHHSSAPRPR